MGRAFRSPLPVVTLAIAALIAISAGGCGGGEDDHANLAPATLSSVTVPADVQPPSTVAEQEAGQGRKAEASPSSNPDRDRSSRSAEKKTGTATQPNQGVQTGSSGKAPAADLPGDGTEPAVGPSAPGPKRPQNGTE